jgi:putative DNA primase/helicase
LRTENLGGGGCLLSQCASIDLFDLIPEELKKLRQWTCWLIQQRNGKPTKVPYNPETGKPSKANDARTWVSFGEAYAGVLSGKYQGIGFEFSPDDQYFGVDLDHCRNPETGAIELWASEIIEELDSYAEVSQSGCGVHIIGRGRKRGDRCKKLLGNGAAIEIYDRERYFIMTGDVVGERSRIENREIPLDKLYNRYFDKQDNESPGCTDRQIIPKNLEDEQILELLGNARNSGKFSALWNGDKADYADDDSSADQALVNLLAFYTKDRAQIDRLFRRSALMRPKWDERRGKQTYGERTIAKAVSAVKNTYSPRLTRSSPETNGTNPGESAPTENPRPFKLWTLDELFAYELDERDNILGDYMLQQGAMTPFIGPPDLGKTRLVIQLIVSLLTGRPDWLGLRIHRHDLKILFLQTENSIRRLRRDLGAMLHGCRPDFRAQVNERLRLFVPQSIDEMSLGLDDPEIIARLKATIRNAQPDITFADPFGDFYAGDNENDAMQMRTTAKLLMQIVRSGNEKGALGVIHHARSGKAAAAGADGWERGSYGRGSKALISIGRAAINLAPADEHDSSAVIVACGKCNDGVRFPAFGVRLDPETMTYSRDEGIDIDAWREAVAGDNKRGPKKRLTVELVASTLKLLGNKAKKKELVAELMRVNECSSTTAYEAVSRADGKTVFAAAEFVTLLDERAK